MTLLRCRDLWGEAHVMYGDPPMRKVDNALYLPFRTDGPWGVYDDRRRIVMEGVDVRGATRTPHQADLAWPDGRDVDHHAPDEDYLYCGWLNPHYGHFLINSLPKFWPLLRKRKGYKIVLAEPLSLCPPIIRTILRRLGVDDGDFVSFDRATKLPSVLVPSSAILEQYWIYTIYGDLCRQISSGLWDLDELGCEETPVYLSKARLDTGVGTYEGEHMIEDIVRTAGMDVVYPETLPFEDQVRLFATRRLLVGPAGSAFHTSVFGSPGRRILTFNPGAAVNSNFALIDMVAGNRAEYFYQDGMTYESSSNFMTLVRSVDPSRLGLDLVDLVRERASWPGA